MSKKVSLPDAGQFNLASFAEILPNRDPIIGEDPGSFDVFHEGLMRSLAPVTPYESVIAENLVAIEWEFVQRRRMREATIRRILRDAVKEAMVAFRGDEHSALLDAAWEQHEESGGQRRTGKSLTHSTVKRQRKRAQSWQRAQPHLTGIRSRRRARRLRRSVWTLSK